MLRVAFGPMPERELLELLPKRPAEEFKRGSLIYTPLQPSTNLYLVVAGRVKVTSAPSNGECVCRLVFKGSLFGEPALVRASGRSDTAIALDAVSLVSWTSLEIEKHIEINPRLGLVLCQYIVQQYLDLSERMQSLLGYKSPERVMLALEQIALRTGVERPDGSVRIEPLTHQTLAEYVGTSREVVTFHLNRLRMLGLISYSRQYIEISLGKVEKALRQNAS